jgi:hypothetical protein
LRTKHDVIWLALDEVHQNELVLSGSRWFEATRPDLEGTS